MTRNLFLEVKKKIVSKSLKFLLILLVWVFVSLNTIIKSQDQFFFSEKWKANNYLHIKIQINKNKI